MEDVARTPSFRVPSHEIGERLGAGGFGEVFAARHTVLQREVAIKILHAKYSANADAVSRFIVEARAVGTISHPGIVELFEIGVLEDGRHYFVMERLRGRTLRDVLRERTRLPLVEALAILRGIADAVDAAHSHGIAHRDLKPDNVFVLADGTVKLIDFGLAKLTTAQDVPVTETGSVFGTPLYMSPEQCRGRDAGLQTDAYSFGALAYHVLVGEPPFSGEALELALHHLNDEPIAPSTRAADLPRRVDDVVLALLAKDPAARPMPLGDAVAAMAGELALRRRRRVRPWLMAGGGLALVAGVVWLVSSGSTREAQLAAAPIDDCVAGNARFAGIWDAATRDAIDQRFAMVQRAEAPAVWRMISTRLDTYVKGWVVRWDEACRAPDRRADPLLYGQRVTCLENAMLAVRGLQQSLAIGDLGELVEGVTHDFIDSNVPPLEDCTDVRRLREQRPAPPPDKRAEIAALGAEWRIARAGFRRGANGGKMSGVDDALARMSRIASRLEELGVFGASESNLVGSYLVNLAVGEASQFSSGIPSRIPQARRAIDEAIRRAETSRDDSVLADALAELARLQVATGESTPSVEATLARGEGALQRAGRAKHATLTWVRSEVMLREGKLAAAIELLRTRLPPFGVRPDASLNLSLALSRSNQHDEAIAECRNLVALQMTNLGEIHLQTAYARAHLATVFENAGDRSAALAELERVEETFDRIGDVVISKRRGVWERELRLAKALARTALVERVQARLHANQ